MEARLRGSNFPWVRDCLALMFQQAKEEGEAQGGYYAFKTEYLMAIRPFMESPTLENAIALLRAEPSLWPPFEESKKLSWVLDENVNDQIPDAVLNAQQMPVIDAGVAAIKLGVFTLLRRKFESQSEPARAVPLAFCVTHSLFSSPIEQADMKAFSQTNEALIEQATRNVFGDNELSEPVLLAYAALMIALGWKTGNPLNPTATSFVERASENDAEIPNIVRAWGGRRHRSLLPCSPRVYGEFPHQLKEPHVSTVAPLRQKWLGVPVCKGEGGAPLRAYAAEELSWGICAASAAHHSMAVRTVK